MIGDSQYDVLKEAQDLTSQIDNTISLLQDRYLRVLECLILAHLFLYNWVLVSFFDSNHLSYFIADQDKLQSDFDSKEKEEEIERLREEVAISNAQSSSDKVLQVQLEAEELREAIIKKDQENDRVSLLFSFSQFILIISFSFIIFVIINSKHICMCLYISPSLSVIS